MAIIYTLIKPALTSN